jgi:DNA-nicking Smr family endonuclease
MKRPLKPEELRVWSLVAATVHPLPGKSTPPTDPSPLAGEGGGRSLTDEGSRRTPSAVRQSLRGEGRATPHPTRFAGHLPEKGIEPRRKHRIAREREEIGARIDLHGMDQDRARAALDGFLRRAWDEGYRAVLVITGKGLQGDGVLKRRTPEWLAAPHLAPIVAGISEAHRKHGGEGALYVALKRKPRG